MKDETIRKLFNSSLDNTVNHKNVDAQTNPPLNHEKKSAHLWPDFLPDLFLFFFHPSSFFSPSNPRSVGLKGKEGNFQGKIMTNVSPPTFFSFRYFPFLLVFSFPSLTFPSSLPLFPPLPSFPVLFFSFPLLPQFPEQETVSLLFFFLKFIFFLFFSFTSPLFFPLDFFSFLSFLFDSFPFFANRSNRSFVCPSFYLNIYSFAFVH